MRRFLSILTLAAFLVYVLNATLTWTVYGLFADRIAEEFCVNPENPCCHGRCYITESIEKQEESKSPTPHIALSPEKILLYVASNEQRLAQTRSIDQLHLPSVASAIRDGWHTRLDPPPRRLS